MDRAAHVSLPAPRQTTAATIWITGISASGKSTLATALCAGLGELGVRNIDVIDGEALRATLDPAIGHGLADRLLVLEHIVARAQAAQAQGSLAIVSTISSQRAMRDFARQNLHPFMEVFLDCPPGVCAARDRKGHFEKAYQGAYELFVGVTEQYERSDRPELTIDTARLDVPAASRLLLASVLQFLGPGHD